MAPSFDDGLFDRHAGSTTIIPNSRSTRQQESLIHASSHAAQKPRGARHVAQSSKPLARAVKSGINFYNYSGTTVKVSASTDELDEDMSFRRRDRAESADDSVLRRRSTALTLLGQQFEKVGRRR